MCSAPVHKFNDVFLSTPSDVRCLRVMAWKMISVEACNMGTNTHAALKTQQAV